MDLAALRAKARKHQRAIEETTRAAAQWHWPAPPVCQVYVIRRADTRELKIGISRDPARRLLALQTAHGAPLDLLVAFPGDETTEAEIHARFDAHRKMGEWFHEAPEITAWIEERRHA